MTKQDRWVKLNVEIRKSYHKQLNVLAAMEDVTVKSILDEILKSTFQKGENELKTIIQAVKQRMRDE